MCSGCGAPGGAGRLCPRLPGRRSLRVRGPVVSQQPLPCLPRLTGPLTTLRRAAGSPRQIPLVGISPTLPVSLTSSFATRKEKPASSEGLPRLAQANLNNPRILSCTDLGPDSARAAMTKTPQMGWLNRQTLMSGGSGGCLRPGSWQTRFLEGAHSPAYR